MTPTPTGRLTQTATGHDLGLSRMFRAPIEDVWASLTESERTARWIGSWTGEPGVGRTVQLQMSFEEGAEPSQVEIVACDPPSHLAVTTSDVGGVWRLEARLSENEGVTTLHFVHHLDSTDAVHDTGPGWEYYLDMLMAAHLGQPSPEWDDYYPAMKAYYEDQVATSARTRGAG